MTRCIEPEFTCHSTLNGTTRCLCTVLIFENPVKSHDYSLNPDL